jgi:hypothetical protein
LTNEIDVHKPHELFDFLYRDRERIVSYYAQLWNGALLSVEESRVESERNEEMVKGDLTIASTESRTVSHFQSADKRTIDMHDAATVDLLLRLTAQRAERQNESGLIQAFTGTCFFLDRNILKYAGPAIDFVLQGSKETQHLSRQQRRLAERKGQKASVHDENALAPIKDFLSLLDMPSGFLLQTVDGQRICGPIKDAGLDQPISSLLFRAGNRGLAETFVVGLVEKFKELGSEMDSPMLKTQKEMGRAVSKLLFPDNAIRLIPLAIYRKISS